MKTRIETAVPLLWLFIVLFLSAKQSLVFADADHPWCYIDEKCGPLNWGGICKSGHSQSPVDFKSEIVHEARFLKKIGLSKDYLKPQSQFFIKNNGHSVQIQFNEEMTSTLHIDGDGLSGAYQLSQLHFHWGSSDDIGSEHTVDGRSYSMELHLVHFSDHYENILTAMSDQNSRALAVVGIFFQVSKLDNPALNPISNALADVRAYHPDPLPVRANPLNLTALFPESLEIFRYQGSLTTPSCGEKVVWTVFKEPVPISERQMQAFRSVLDSYGRPLVNNFRPTQPITRRKIITGTIQLTDLKQENQNEIDTPKHVSHEDSFEDHTTTLSPGHGGHDGQDNHHGSSSSESDETTTTRKGTQGGSGGGSKNGTSNPHDRERNIGSPRSRVKVLEGLTFGLVSGLIFSFLFSPMAWT